MANIKDISLSQYLSYSPLAPAAIYLKFMDNLQFPSISTKAVFTVEVETNENTMLTAITKPVELIP